ncbi:MAG: hypothetical protein J0L92_33105, partial [Deltaproteobacteria bacterium]|nr:hypothetical protein [Deltaproteobacteria bacterium]
WRFRDLIPFAPPGMIVTIGEGQTLLQSADKVGQYVGLDAGRLWFPLRNADPATQCAIVDTLQLSSSEPVGVATGVGAHVGVEWAAFGALDPLRAGSARRAASLGVGHALVVTDAPAATGWRARRMGAMQLWSLEGGASLVAPTCVRERWVGDDATLRRELYAALADSSGADQLLSPDVAVELVVQDSPPRRETMDAACDARATVDVERAEPGDVAASITSDRDVDIVVRVTATDTWTVSIDGQETPWRMVAPGFLVVHVPSGSHALVAAASWPRGYFVGVALGLLLALSLAWADALRDAITRYRRSTAAPPAEPTAR